MGGGNGQKAKTARERAAAKGPKEAKSQLKSNEAAKTLKCTACFQTFLQTTRAKALQDHTESRHSDKAAADCFPMFDFTKA